MNANTDDDGAIPVYRVILIKGKMYFVCRTLSFTFGYLLIALIFASAEGVRCKKQLAALRATGLVGEGKELLDTQSSRTKSYSDFATGKDTEVLGQGGTAIVVRELAPQQRVAKIYDTDEFGKSYLEQDRLLLTLLTEFKSSRASSNFNVCKILESDGNILFLQDIWGVEHREFRESPQSSPLLVKKRDELYTETVLELQRNFKNFLEHKGYRDVVATPFAATPPDKNFPQGNLPALTIKFKSQEGKGYELILRSDNVVFDTEGALWIVDPH